MHQLYVSSSDSSGDSTSGGLQLLVRRDFRLGQPVVNMKKKEKKEKRNIVQQYEDEIVEKKVIRGVSLFQSFYFYQDRMLCFICIY